jgi:hypothetical protein
MANHPKPMYLIRRLIELRLKGHSKRSISRHLSLARKTVDKYLQELESHFSNLSQLSDWSEESLYQLLHPQTEPCFNLPGALLHPQLYASFADFDKKLSKVGINRHLLWQQYLQSYQGKGTPLAYGQFCHHYQLYSTAGKVSLHIQYKAGEKLFIDFAGTKLKVVLDGVSRELEVFVATLPCIGMCYAEAIPSLVGCLKPLFPIISNQLSLRLTVMNPILTRACKLLLLTTRPLLILPVVENLQIRHW